MWFLNEATNFAPATELSPTSVAANDELNTVGALTPSTTTILSVPSKLNLSNEYLPALVLPESLDVQDDPPGVALYILVPLAANTTSAKEATIKTFSDALEV
eukprot:GHVO01003668.1.p2 GENE.GHVO01003668.1~~GHVO01003668.1.p2  ORF type:complete len:102 (+),score=3.93 GHVO01003668.1:140-445(+)